MNKKLIFITTIALVLAGCGDNNDATTGEPSMLDKTMDSTGDAVNAIKNTTSDAVEGAGDTASDVADAVSEKADSIVDSTSTEDMSTEEALEYMDREIEKLSGE